MIGKDEYGFTFGIDYIDNKNYCFFDMHYELELGIVLSGRITRYNQNLKTELATGDIWFTNIWEPHGLKIKEAPAEIAIFVIKPESIAYMDISDSSDLDLLAPFFSSPKNRPTTNTIEEKNTALDIAYRAKKALNKKGKYSHIIFKLLTLELLIQTQENWIKKRISSSHQFSNYLKISPAINLVFNTKELISVKTAAAECGLSEKTFSRNFKQIMGYTFSQYSLNYRVKSSANELIHSDILIKELVYKWGFTDESHFNKLFQKFFNCNPGEYRNKYLN